jgi:hypothetical protein
MIITTVKGAKFNTELPARSSVIKVLNNSGNSVMDTLRITGNTETVTEFMEPVSMIEVDGSFGKDWVNEDFIWQ